MNKHNAVLYAFSMEDVERLIELVIDKARKTELIGDKNISPEEDRLSQKEAALLLGISVQTLINWKKQGFVTYYQINRSIFYSKRELLDLARNNNRLVRLPKD